MMSNVEYLIVRSYKLTQTEFLAEQIEPHNTQRERERERESLAEQIAAPDRVVSLNKKYKKKT
jgi:hypothetical protein